MSDQSEVGRRTYARPRRAESAEVFGQRVLDLIKDNMGASANQLDEARVTDGLGKTLDEF